MTARPRLAITLGDVRGIGPEIVLKAAASREVRDAADLVLVGPSGSGVDVTEQTGIVACRRQRRERRTIRRDARSSARSRSRSRVPWTESSPRRSTRRRCSPAATRIPGHTEMLATLTGRRVAMMLAATTPRPGATEPAARGARDDASSVARRRRGRHANGDRRRGDASRVADFRNGLASPSRGSRCARSIRTPATAGGSARRRRGVASGRGRGRDRRSVPRRYGVRPRDAR